ncbi:hypothetical protein ACWCRF_11120 [Streptomyces sp. NPDC002405]
MSRRIEKPVADHPARSSHPPVTASPHARHNHAVAGNEGEARP